MRDSGEFQIDNNLRRGRFGCVVLVVVLLVAALTALLADAYPSAGRAVFALLILPLIAAALIAQRFTGKKN